MDVFYFTRMTRVMVHEVVYLAINAAVHWNWTLDPDIKSLVRNCGMNPRLVTPVPIFCVYLSPNLSATTLIPSHIRFIYWGKNRHSFIPTELL